MKEKHEKLLVRVNQSETKRKLDLEGYCSDLSNLKKRMVFYQNYIGKLKTLVDKEEDNIISVKRRALYSDMENDVIMEEDPTQEQEEEEE